LINHFFYLIIFFTAFSFRIFAQNNFVVKDSISGKVIPGVNIRNLSGSEGTSTSAEGNFSLILFKENDTIIFSHISYLTKIHSTAEIKEQKIILLIPSTIAQDEVLIVDNKINDNSFSEKIIIDENLAVDFINVGDLLKSHSSLNIRDYGGFGGVKTASARGLGSENTIVLFNEARVNDLRTGQFDLASLSPFSIGEITYLKNDDHGSFYSSAGGILKINTQKNIDRSSASAGFRLSSDLYQNGYFSLIQKAGNLSFSLAGERSYSSNKYEYKFAGNYLQRLNAHFNKSFLSAGISFLTDELNLNLYSGYTHFNSGIPGFVVTNNFASSRAWNKSQSFLTIINGSAPISKHLKVISAASVHKQNLAIADPDGFVIFSNETKNSNLFDASMNSRIEFKNYLSRLSGGYEYSYADIKNITTIISANEAPSLILRRIHKFYSVFSQKFLSPFNAISVFGVNGGMGYEFVDEELFIKSKSDLFSYKVGLNVVPKFAQFLIFKSHYSNDYRFPTFNERFYSALFNHYDLQKESYKTIDAGIETGTDDIFFSIVYFNIQGKDKIIWIPTRLALQTPRNIAKVSSEGMEIKIEKFFLNKSLNFSLFYNYNSVKNKTQLSANDFSFNKFLIYSPEHQLNLNFSFKHDNFLLSVYNSFTSKRYYTSDNSPTSVLPGYFITDLSLAYKFELFDLNHSISTMIYNVFDNEYFVIQSYPMPLRTFLLTYNLEIK
jgi:vitamin B12 transporter